MVSRFESAAELVAACREGLSCDMHMRESRRESRCRFMLRHFMQCLSIQLPERQ